MRRAKRSSIARSFSGRSREGTSKNVSAPSGPNALLGLDAVAHGVAVGGLGDLATPLSQFTLRRADQVAPARLPEPRKTVRAGHAVIYNSDALRDPETILPRRDDLLDRRHVRAIAREEFVAARHAVPGDDERAAHLLTVRAMIATLPALREVIGTGCVDGLLQVGRITSWSRPRSYPGPEPGCRSCRLRSEAAAGVLHEPGGDAGDR
jgi:hypothetical protein